MLEQMLDSSDPEMVQLAVNILLNDPTPYLHLFEKRDYYYIRFRTLSQSRTKGYGTFTKDQWIVSFIGPWAVELIPADNQYGRAILKKLNNVQERK